MSTDRASDPPLPGAPSNPVELAEELRRLRRWAGQPSLRRLRQLGGTQRTSDGDGEIDALPESTTSYILRGKRPPGADFVHSFVAACLRARQYGPSAVAEHVEQWHVAWLHASGMDADTTAAEEPPEAPAEQPADQPAEAPAERSAVPVPRQLPADVGGFAGRATERATLEESLADDARGPAPAVVTITGTAGVGKTALAVHVAHRMASQYPDGQLFLDLYGFTASPRPVEPAQALDRLLRTLGVPGEQIPLALDDRAALWRSMLAERRLLVLLDNAANEQQVMPLLPGVAGCLVLVTSRRRLASMDNSCAVSLDPLPQADAVALFDGVAGPGRTSAARAEVAEAVALCGGLPLAIRIVASRLHFHPTWQLADLLTRLRDQDQRLVELADDSGVRSVAAALEVSYHQLSPDQKLLYRRLGMHPGPHIEAYGAAALLDTDLQDARRLLDQLLDVHLLQESTPGRYTFHDLVRTHAVHLAATEPGPGWRRFARARRIRAVHARLRDYYCHAASRAMDVAYPHERVRRPTVPSARTPVPGLPDQAAATEWLDAELPNILAVAHHATGHGPAEPAWHLCATVERHLVDRGHYQEAKHLYEAALDVASGNGDQQGMVVALVGLGRIHTIQAHHDRARDLLTRALAIARATGDCVSQAQALYGLGRVRWWLGQYERALGEFWQAQEKARLAGDRSGECEALLGIGQTYLIQGKFPSGLEACEHAWRIGRATGNLRGQLNALICIGRAHRQQGQHAQAIDALERALEAATATGNRTGELHALWGLGFVYLVQRRHEASRDVFAQAIEVARATGNRSSELGVLVALGHLHRSQGRHDEAVDCYQRVLAPAAQAGSRNYQFEALHGLGRLYRTTGRGENAVDHHRQALALAEELGQLTDQARAYDGLAHAHHAVGRTAEARTYWQRALDILTDLGIDHTDDEEATVVTIRAQLEGTAEPDRPSCASKLPRSDE